METFGMTLKPFVRFFELALYALGTIGGIGWSLYCHGYLIAVAVAVLSAMAFPEARKAWRVLSGEDDDNGSVTP